MGPTAGTSKKDCFAGFRSQLTAFYFRHSFAIPVAFFLFCFISLIPWYVRYPLWGIGFSIPIVIFGYIWLRKPDAFGRTLNVFCQDCDRHLLGEWVCPYCSQVHDMHPFETCPNCDKQANTYACPRCGTENVLDFDGDRKNIAHINAASVPVLEVPPSEVEQFSIDLAIRWEKRKLSLRAEFDSWKELALFEQEQLREIQRMETEGLPSETANDLREDLKDFLRHQRYA